MNSWRTKLIWRLASQVNISKKQYRKLRENILSFNK